LTATQTPRGPSDWTVEHRRHSQTIASHLAIYAPLRKPNNGGYIAVNIIEHPEGTAKKIAIRNDLVTASSGTELRYFTDTKQGSSGSPVLDDQWRVAALHRGSTVAENVQFQGRTVAWVNLGTQITAILEHLKQAFPSVASEIAA
jgi:endonuclease G, mitochondrial